MSQVLEPSPQGVFRVVTCERGVSGLVIERGEILRVGGLDGCVFREGERLAGWKLEDIEMCD